MPYGGMGENCSSQGGELFFCYDLLVPQLSVLVIKLAWVWTEYWYNGGSFGSCPKGIFVVIDTHWVLCYCLMTHRFCVLAGSFASALATGSA